MARHDDADMAADLVLDIADHRSKAKNGAMDVDRLVIEQSAGCGELEPSGLAVDQAFAEPVFQALERA